MRLQTAAPTLAMVILSSLALFLLSVSAPLSPSDGDDPSGWIDEVYAPFDSLKTDITDYQWPTDATKILTSSFAEFRRTHFHAGIDISTRNQKGFRVFAARSGYVSRVYVSPSGYGKMLEVRHSDGFTTRYAHLQRFNDAIDEYAKSRQRGRGIYSLDVRLPRNRFPVKKGDVIAYTGDTGIGAPHLHFELRDPRGNPINPLRLPVINSSVEDDHPPHFITVALAPLTFDSQVDGHFEPRFFEAIQKSPTYFHIQRPVRVSGSIGLSVYSRDRVNNTWHRNGPYEISMFLDDSLVYHSQRAQLLAWASRQVALHYDWPLVESRGRRYQKLFINVGNRVPLYDRMTEGSGIITTSALDEGPHEIRIVARDYKGNESTFLVPVSFGPNPRIDVAKVEQSYVLVPGDRKYISTIQIAYRSASGKRWKGNSFAVGTLDTLAGGFVLPLSDPSDGVVRVTGKSSDGRSSSPVYLAASSGISTASSLDIEKRFFATYLRVKLRSHLPFSLRPSLWVSNGPERHLLDVTAVNEQTYSGTLPLSALRPGITRIEAHAEINGASVETVDEFSVYPILPEVGGSIVTGDGEFTVEFPPDGVYEPLYCRLEKTENGYRLLPDDVLLKRPARVTYQVDSLRQSTHWGLYVRDDSDFGLLATANDRQPGTFTGRLSRMLGTVTVLPDTVSPSISGLKIDYRRGTLSIRFETRDDRSGIEADSIKLYLNDQQLVPEYNPYDRLVVFTEKMKLSKGTYTVRARVRDKIGNLAEQSGKLTVAR